MLGTCPDISYAVIKMAQFTSNPSSDHMNKAKQIIRYLGSTPDLSLVFDGGSDKGIVEWNVLSAQSLYELNAHK